ncbi:MAG TPA: exo-beta-N-acetylmuramidase NamZ domain-containing protein [Bryobacteraceae bacterium]|nr:exo-beta-N-acetylmuramidase NamZ domain-containing protein [Bryobacteraceae bacterium]
MRTVALILLFALAAFAQDQFAGSANLDAAIEDAILNDHAPGAVCLIWSKGKVVHRKAYGNRSLSPSREAMTVDTIFDAASLTKVVATTASLMKLFDQGQIRLSDKVTVYLPGFQNGKSDITIRHLLTHFSGLRPDVDLEPAWSGYDLGVRKALVDRPVAQPGERFIYSDINFILLGEIVYKLSGKPLDRYAKENIFDPIGMKHTLFQPAPGLRSRIAPTERYPGMAEPLRGVVHDPTTRYMGGVAGHAGLFTTADDLGKFAAMMLNQGEVNGQYLISPLTIRKFTEPQTPPDQTILRGLGFDIDSQYSSNRGELFPIGSFGHTGFTGTSLWMDPYTKTAVVLLTNSVHPGRRPPVAELRSKVATIAAAAVGIDAPGITLTGYNETQPVARRAVARNASVRNGIDVLAADGFAPLRGKRVGLITNHTGLTREGKRNIDAMVAAHVNLVALFSPEHGIAGTEDHENIGDVKDKTTGIPVHSLYKGQQRRPNRAMLQGVDVLVFDIQDVGARYYTYACTMWNAMEEASRLGVAFLVLDRPNPITGTRVEGPVLEHHLESFVGCFPMPLRHGMTMGELARMMHDEHKLTGRLEVISVRNWQRGDWLDATGLTWVDPSPNMRSLNAALLYPGLAMLEYSRNYSVGRGTDAPFEQIGADWINGAELAGKLNARNIPGVRVYATTFTPKDSNLKGIPCQGLRFLITDRERFSPTRLGIELAAMLEKLYPGKIAFEKNERLIGSSKTIQAIRAGTDARVIEQNEQEAIRAFLAIRGKYLLYR